MNEKLKALAQQAKPSPNLIWEDAELERFAELVRQDERAACVKIALRYEPTERSRWVRYAADEMRARGNHEPT